MSLKSFQQSFLTPPVCETSLSVQFEELDNFKEIHFGLYFTEISDAFPTTEDNVRLSPILEVFPYVSPEITLRFMPDRHGMHRVIYFDQSRTNLLQLQPDRFSLNWKRGEGAPEYPSFERTGEAFIKEFDRFSNFCLKANLGKPRPNLCEMLYVNQIFPAKGESAAQCMQEILGITPMAHAREEFRDPQILTFNRVFEIGNQEGRMYIEGGIGQHPSEGESFVMKITSRVFSESNDLQDAIQKAHDWAIAGFLSVTTERAQESRWGITK